MTRNTKVVLVFTLIIPLFLGYAAGRGYKTYEINLEKRTAQIDNKQVDQNKAQKSDMQDSAKELVSPYVYAPKIVSLVAEKDSMSGYNLKINTGSFRFAPELVGKQVTQNTGHAHVYVNNVKVGRVYSEWVNIPDSFFKTGTNTISVTLNANNHNVWWSKKGSLEARANLDIFK